ncbi:MAG: isochorismatase family cysteine hydrolase, partial [Patescibacteria group bacterium]
MTKKALIIIDLQKGFINELTQDIPYKTKKYIEENQNDFDLVLFTQFINHSESVFVKQLEYKDFMEQHEYDLVNEIKEFVGDENLFQKDTYGSFVDDEMLDALRLEEIKEVYLGGIATENCVLTFARDAFDRSFKVKVIKDLCASPESIELHNVALQIIENN